MSMFKMTFHQKVVNWFNPVTFLCLAFRFPSVSVVVSKKTKKWGSNATNTAIIHGLV